MRDRNRVMAMVRTEVSLGLLGVGAKGGTEGGSNRSVEGKDMVVAGAENFVSLVKRSRLVDDPSLAKLIPSLRAAGDHWEQAAILVKAGLLTPFQAYQLRNGNSSLRIGNYVLLDQLGQGGMGTVYLAEHRHMKRRVALKVLPENRSGDRSAVERFYREAKAVAAVDHDNIVRAHDVDQVGSTHFLIMEFVDGASLHDLMRSSGPMKVDRSAHYIYQAAKALQHAHEMGLVHRDIKPSNLLVDRQGVLKLLDLGLAKFFHDEEDNITREHDERVIGTVDYMSPEQAMDSQAVDIRADIYSLGCTWYFLLTGQPPFTEGTIAQKLLWHQHKMPKPILECRPDLPPPLASILERMIAKEPSKRFQTPGAVAKALEAFAKCSAARPTPNEMNRVQTARAERWTSEAPLSRSESASRASRITSLTNTRIPKKARSGHGDRTAALPATGVRPKRKRRDKSQWVAAIAASLVIAIMSPLLIYVAFFWSKEEPERSPEWGGDSQVKRDPGRKVTKFDGNKANPPTDRRNPVGQPPDTKNKDKTGIKGWVPDKHPDIPVEPIVPVNPDPIALNRLKDALKGGFGNIPVGENKNIIANFKDHESEISCLAFSGTGKLLAGADVDKKLIFWDLEAKRRLTAVDVPGSTPRVLQFRVGDKSVCGVLADGTFLEWDMDGKELCRRGIPNQKTVGVGLSLDAGVWATSIGASIRIWSIETGERLREFAKGEAEVHKLAFSPDGTILASAGADQHLRWWDHARSRMLHEVKGNRYMVESIDFSPDGRTVASGGTEARLWDVLTGEDRGQLIGEGLFDSAAQLKFLGDGRVVTCGGMSMMRIWDLRGGKPENHLGGQCMALATRLLKPILAMGLSNGTVLLWDIPNNENEEDKADSAQSWKLFIGLDSARSYRAQFLLAARSAETLPMAKELIDAELKACASERLAALTADLDGEFERRDLAMEDLLRLGELAGPYLRKQLDGMPKEVVRERITRILGRIEEKGLTPENIRLHRVVELLERMGNPEAKELLTRIAKETPGTSLAAQAEAACRRLGG